LKITQEIVVTLKKVQVDLGSSSKIIKDLVPAKVQQLVEACNQLSDKGHIIFLYNIKSPDESYIILNTIAILKRFNGSFFAPKEMEQHCSLGSSTGVVPKSKLVNQFQEFDIDLVVGMLAHLEWAAVISDPEALFLINEHIKKLKEPSLPLEDS